MAAVRRDGFTQLPGASRRDNGYRLNIVFVHGLRGHPKHTWEWTPSSDDDKDRPNPPKDGIRTCFKSFFNENPAKVSTLVSGNHRSVFWPETLLAEDLSEARIWTYGYNADVIGGFFKASNSNSVSQHGNNFAVQIDRDLDNKDPIIFVAHSLGGIIVKDAIRRSPTCAARTKLVIFLGTPHRGSDAASWGVIASNLARLALQNTNKNILRALQVNGEVLDNINEEFVTVVTKTGIRIHSFQEAKAVVGIRGLDGKVVSDFSSKLGLSKSVEQTEIIDANHMQLARCPNREDSRYRAIYGVLCKFVRENLSSEGSVPQEEQSHHIPLPTEMGESSRSHSSLAPFYNLAFDQNAHFIGRKETLDELRDLLFTKQRKKAALVGLGGMGKTQVALELAYWTKENMKHHSVFWVSALSSATFERAFVEIAALLPIQWKKDDNQDPKDFARDYLSSDVAGPWLLILDNVDFILPGMTQYLPRSNNGRTLVTTRSRDVAYTVADHVIVDLKEMSPSESKGVLNRWLSAKYLADESQVEQLLDKLGYLPLAIAQAGAYIGRNQTSIAKYLGLLQNTEEDLVGLMTREFYDETRYEGSKNAVARTLIISFVQIQQNDPKATDLLSFISQIEPKAIPKFILPFTGTAEEMLSAIGTLCGYAFLRESSTDVFDMHSLVHVATRIWVREQRITKNAEDKAIRHLADIKLQYEYEHRERRRSYIPHAICALKRIESTHQEKHNLSFVVGCWLLWERRDKEAVQWLKETCY